MFLGPNKSIQLIYPINSETQIETQNFKFKKSNKPPKIQKCQKQCQKRKFKRRERSAGIANREMSFGFNFFDDNEAEKDGSTWYSSINDDCAKLSSEILEFPLLHGENRPTDFESILIEGVTFHRRLKIDSNKYQEDSDLIPGVYEGGFKVWECTMDTIKYLQNTPHLLSRISGASILDLGCGHGFLGIYCLMNNATKVSFSDFNEEVIRGPTCQNILRNCPLQSAKAVCQAGDWLQLHNKLTAR